MTVRQTSKHELAGALQARYLKARRQQKTQILDEFCAATGYHRKYAPGLVRHGPPAKRPRVHRLGRPMAYGQEVVTALQVAAEATDWICGKRLAAALPDLIPALEREGGAHGTASGAPVAVRALRKCSQCVSQRRMSLSPANGGMWRSPETELTPL